MDENLEPMITIRDENDDIVIQKDVDTTKSATYTVMYEAIDKAGNKAESLIITIEVLPIEYLTPSVIKDDGDINRGKPFVNQTVTATDDVDEEGDNAEDNNNAEDENGKEDINNNEEGGLINSIVEDESDNDNKHESLDSAQTNEEIDKSSGDTLPEKTTNTYLWLVLGAIIIMIGLLFPKVRKVLFRRN